MFSAIGNPALGEIFRQIGQRRRLQLYLLLGLLLIGAIAELFAIAAVIPFLTLLAGSDELGRFGGVQFVFEWLGASSPRERLLVATGIFAAAAVVAGTLRIALTWMTQSFSFGLGHDLGMAIQTRLLHQPYSFHSSTNSSDLVAAHEKVFALIHGVVLPALYGFTAAVTSLFIIAILAYIDPLAAGIAVVGVAAIYLTVTLFTRQRLHLYGSMINSAHSQRVQAVQESIGGIRDVLIDHSQAVHLAHFARISRRIRRAEVLASFISSTPRFVVETAGMVLIAVLALLLSARSGSFATALPVLGAIALSAQRLLPLLQQVYQGWAQVRTGSATTNELARLLDLDLPPETAGTMRIPVLPFRDEVRFDGVSFRYPGRREWALRDINLSIPRGSRIALVGRTGSGKSTLVDLLMGLLDPTEGLLEVDGVPPTGTARIAWQSQIAHVPQAIFLADSTIERNIAFGWAEEDIDSERVRWASRLAQADEFIAALPDKYGTYVGERGIRLSGGQRQRIGIARALYKRAPVLIFDEATSALDRETETAVIKGIASMGEEVTLVMIAHRLATIAHCDAIVRLDRGRIVQVGAYADVVGSSDRKETVRNLG